MAIVPPKAVQTKIYKIGQTRGADDDVIFQNRVGRNSTVLIPYYEFEKCKTAALCKIQLEYLFWSCKDIKEFIKESGLDEVEVSNRIELITRTAQEKGLSDKNALFNARIIDNEGFTICPLCLKHISAKGFCSRTQQAEGRDVPDLTVTGVSLFHIRELRTGEFNHKPYNLNKEAKLPCRRFPAASLS